MFIELLKLLGVVGVVGLMAVELMAIGLGFRSAIFVNAETWTKSPLTFKVRCQIGALEGMWYSFIFGDALRRACRVPNYPIKTGMMMMGGLTGYLTALTGAPLLAAIGAGMGSALSTGLGAYLALRHREGYQEARKRQIAIMWS